MIEILIVLVVLGVALYLLNAYVPMAPPFKVIINAIIVLALIVYLLQGFGLIGSWHFGRHWR